MQRRHFLWLAGSVGALAAALLVAGGALLLPAGQAVRLPSGETLRLKAVTRGAPHGFDPLPPWQRFLDRARPAALQAPVYVPHFYADQADAALILWFTGPVGPRPTSAPRRAFAADESGREYAQADNLWTAHPGHPRVEYYRVPPPARGDRVTLRFYEEAGPPVGSVTISVPRARPDAAAAASRPAPEWQNPPAPSPGATRCPVRVRSGPISVTLVDLTTGLDSGGRGRSIPEVLFQPEPRPAMAGSIPWTRTALRVEDGGRGWAPVTLTLRDGDGTRCSQSYQQVRKGLVWGATPGFIGRDGGPFTARVMLQRRAPRPAPEATWTLRGLDVPAPGAETAVNRSRRIGRALLEVSALAADSTPTRPGPREVQRQPYVRLRATGLQPGHVLEAWAEDERGRRHPTQNEYHGRQAGSQEIRVRMAVPPAARRVSLGLSLQPPPETRFVDVTAEPRRLASPETGGIDP